MNHAAEDRADKCRGGKCKKIGLHVGVADLKDKTRRQDKVGDADTAEDLGN